MRSSTDFCVGLQVIVAIGKAESALVGAGDLHHGVFGVRLGAEIEQRVDAVVVQARQHCRQLLLVLDSASMRSSAGFSGAMPLALMPASSMQE